MRILRVSEDVVPVGQFKAPAEYDRLTEHERFLDSVSAGLADAEAGRLHTTDEVRRRLGVPRKRPR